MTPMLPPYSMGAGGTHGAATPPAAVTPAAPAQQASPSTGAQTPGSTVVAAGEGTRRAVAGAKASQGPSREGKMAEQLCLELVAAAPAALLDWAVAVFRPSEDAQPVLLVTSNMGPSYIPQGVLLPSTARNLLSSVSEGTRTALTGAMDPVHIITEYARHDVPQGTVVAVATTSTGSSAGAAELIRVSRQAALAMPAPVGAGRLHRLRVAWPDVAAAIGRVAPDRAVHLAGALTSLAAVGSDGSGPAVRDEGSLKILTTLGQGTMPSDAEWTAFRDAAALAEGETGAMRPPPGQLLDRLELDRYMSRYQLERIREMLLLWRWLPPSLEDVAYCAAEAGADRREMLAMIEAEG